MKIPKYFRTAFDTYKWDRRTIGTGPSGEVVSARSGEGLPVAIKVFRPRRLEASARLGLKEALIFSFSQKRQGILQPLDFGNVRLSNRDTPFVVMERFKNNLADWAKTDASEEQLLHLASRLVDGLETAHLEGIVHGRLKPENVLFGDDGELYISDWGSRYFEGRPDSYSAPEWTADGASKESDVYSLGLILADILKAVSGEKDEPHEGLELIAELSEKMTQHSPERRLGTLSDVKKTLLAGKSVERARESLKKLSSSVIAQRKLEDPLIVNPIQLTGERDYRDGKLYLKLSQPVTYGWTLSFASMEIAEVGEVVFDKNLRPIEPKSFVFKNDTVYNTIEPGNAQRLVDYLKACIERANQKFKHDMEEAARSLERSEREALQQKIEDERRSVSVIESLNI